MKVLIEEISDDSDSWELVGYEELTNIPIYAQKDEVISTSSVVED